MLLQAQLLSDQGKIVLNKMGNPENRKKQNKNNNNKTAFDNRNPFQTTTKKEGKME